MAVVNTFRCDICGTVKQESNHWFRAFRVPGPRWTLVPWELHKRDEAAEEQHLCGIPCASKAMARVMEQPEEASCR